MRQLVLALAAATTVSASAILADRAEAMTLGTPAGMRAAIDGVAVAESIHCVPGWVHWHRWGWGTGCAVVPLVAVAPRRVAVVAPVTTVVVAPRRVVRYRRW